MIAPGHSRGKLFTGQSRPVLRWFGTNVLVTQMIWGKRDKERERYYLLPGMGGKASRRKHNRILAWSIAAGLLVSMVLALVLLLANNFKLR